MKLQSALLLLTQLLALPTGVASIDQCPLVEPLGGIDLPFNAAFLRVEEFDDDAGTSLVVTSFFNVAIAGPPPFTCLKRDLVARIPNIDDVNGGYMSMSPEVLTDLDSPPCENTPYPPPPPTDTVWPNDGIRAKDGVFPFEALIVPQGFINTPIPGRLTAIDLDDPARREYVIHQSKAAAPRFYHDVVFFDVDGDGMDDIVTVRSGFNPPLGQLSPIGELVWFKNPGTYDPAVGWEEHILYGLSEPPLFQFGPDIALTAHDFDGDGIPEFVATSFFQRPMQGIPETSSFAPKISIFGVPEGVTSWAEVDARNPTTSQARFAVISNDQGYPFEIEIVDLNGDGKMDILATNHQNSLNWATVDPIPGRVYALEQPEGDIFVDPWTTHVLLDDIRPMDTLPGARASRMAPGHAVSFLLKGHSKPWIVAGGDEASKVWLLTPLFPDGEDNWEYTSMVIFDINDIHGPNTTQTLLEDPAGISISTIGRVAIHSIEDGEAVILFIPVFEATDVHVYRISSDCGITESGATTSDAAKRNGFSRVVALAATYLFHLFAS